MIFIISILLTNNYYGPDVDIVLMYQAEDVFSVCRCDYLKNGVYPYDMYQIRFFYDRKIDPNNCKLTIEGKWYNLISLVDKFYEVENNKTISMESVSDLTNEIYDIADKFEFVGKFSECYVLLTKIHLVLST